MYSERIGGEVPNRQYRERIAEVGNLSPIILTRVPPLLLPMVGITAWTLGCGVNSKLADEK